MEFIIISSDKWGGAVPRSVSLLSDMSSNTFSLSFCSAIFATTLWYTAPEKGIITAVPFFFKFFLIEG